MTRSAPRGSRLLQEVILIARRRGDAHENRPERTICTSARADQHTVHCVLHTLERDPHFSETWLRPGCGERLWRGACPLLAKLPKV